MSSVNNTAERNFSGLGIAPALLGILSRLEYRTPTPIQEQAIPVAIQGKDIVGIAQTGTGKTLAFGIPMIQRLAQVNPHTFSRGIESRPHHPLEGVGVKAQGLVVLPTRELALQVDEMLGKVGRGLGLQTAVLIGGMSFGPQLRSLSRKPHIIIATPGRLIDHLNQKNLRLDGVHIVVFDEADRMLDMGFMPQIQKILAVLPKSRQTMLFSATMPQEIMRIASSHMKLPVRVEITPPGTTVGSVTQELFIVPREQKISLLGKLLETYRGPTLVFTRTKYGAKKVTHQIRAMNINVAEIHSNRSLNQRREALDGFKSGRYRVLVATDIASRGIDVMGIELVLNFDLPSTSDDYVHRIGRTARMGAGGHAITFAAPGEEREVRAIERLIRKPIPASKLPTLPSVRIPDFFETPRERGRSFGKTQGRPFPYRGRARYSHGTRRL